MRSGAGKIASSTAPFLKRQLLALLPGFVFFFLLFNIRTATDTLILGHSDATPSGTLALVALAMVASRLVIIADRLPVARALSREPLIFATLAKSLVYAVFALVYRLAKVAVPRVLEHGLSAGVQLLSADVDWRRFWGIRALADVRAPGVRRRARAGPRGGWRARRRQAVLLPAADGLTRPRLGESSFSAARSPARRSRASRPAGT
ncbi:MAG: hypothetical protein QM765_00960 [Myxococcales bacterium]